MENESNSLQNFSYYLGHFINNCSEGIINKIIDWNETIVRNEWKTNAGSDSIVNCFIQKQKSTIKNVWTIW